MTAGNGKDRTVYCVPQVGTMTGNPRIEVQVPGSKSITNRALLLATLAEGKSLLKGVLFSDDSRHFLQCIQDLGFQTLVEEEKREVTVIGQGGRVPKAEGSLYVGSAGTAARFLSAYLGISKGTYLLDASPQMRKRPMAPLLQCLKDLGCQVICHEREGYFPFTIRGNGFENREVTVDIDSSSQFLSALLIASGLSEEDIVIRVTGSHGMSYIRMTERMMAQFGVRTGEVSQGCYVTKKGQAYEAREYQIEPDVSAACYFYAMAPLLGISVLVKQVHFDSLQGDVAFLKILEEMGCTITQTPEGVMVTGNPQGRYRGVTVDMSACSDQAITLAAIAPFADSPTTIKGIGHIRFQESDRIHGIVTELRKLGITCEEGEDWIKIFPGEPRGRRIETYEDHRMAISGFSLIGLRTPNVVIHDPMCCRKTFEEYFDVLDAVVEELTSSADDSKVGKS